jgi:TP901 family phage tail tape measure protein
MAVSNIVLNIITKGADLAKRQLDGIGKSGDKSSKGLGKFGKAMGVTAVAGAVAMAKALSSATKQFMEFDDAMTQSLAIMNATEEQQRRMEQTAREVAITTSFSAQQSAESFFFLASAGLDAEQQIQALPQVAKFAQAGMFDMATATDLATDAQSALGLTVNDAQQNLENLTRVTDVLVKANTLANASVQQFSEALTSKAGSALKVVNKDIEEGVAVLAVFADAGVKGAEGGEKLNQVLRDIPRATAKNGEEFRKLGLEMFDAEGNMRNVADIVEELDRVLKPMSDELKASTLDQLGLNRGVADAVKILSGSTDKIREYESALRDSGGTTEEVADKQIQSLSQQVGIAGDKFAEIGLILADKFAPALEDAIGLGNKFLDEVILRLKGDAPVKSIEEQAQAIAMLSGAFAGAMGGGSPVVNFVEQQERLEEILRSQQNANLLENYASNTSYLSSEIERANAIQRDQINNAHRYEIEQDRLNHTIETATEVTEDLNDAEDDLVALREEKGLKALQSVFKAYQKIEDIKQNIIDLEKEEKEKLDLLNDKKLDEETAINAVKLAEEELARQKELSKQVTLEEEIAILRQADAVKRLEEIEERSTLQNKELELAKRRLTELRIESESATREEEQAEQDLIRAQEDLERATRSVEKAQEDYIKSAEEVAKATDGSTDEILEMAIAKAELDKALADATGLGTFTELVSLMADDVTNDLQSVIDKFLEISALGDKPITVGDGGGGGGDTPSEFVPPAVDVPDGSQTFDVTGALVGTGDTGAGSSFAGSDAFKTIQYQTNNFNFEGQALTTSSEIEDKVMAVVEKAQQRGLSFA